MQTAIALRHPDDVLGSDSLGNLKHGKWAIAHLTTMRPGRIVFRMVSEEGLRLEFSDDRDAVTALEDVNAELSKIGAHISPLDLRAAPADIRSVIGVLALSDRDAEKVKAHFILPRERLLEVIGDAGRMPHVADGGALSTFVTSHGYSYPQLWVVRAGLDYSRFDRFHVNAAEDGTGVDEIVQILFGTGVVIRHRIATGEIVTLRVDCRLNETGWLVTYDGGKPHVGSLSEASPWTKVLTQVIGPERWSIRYETEAKSRD